MTRDELNNSNDTNILGAGKVTKARHGTHNDNIADYIDSQWENGIAVKNGNAVSVNFTVIHGISSSYTVHITPASEDTMINFYLLDVSAGNFTIAFATPPPSGTGNVVFHWFIKTIPS